MLKSAEFVLIKITEHTGGTIHQYKKKLKSNISYAVKGYIFLPLA
jgi:hypothetical protein